MGMFNSFKKEMSAYKNAMRAADNSLRSKRAMENAGFMLAKDVRGRLASKSLATGAMFGAVGYAYNTATGNDGLSGAVSGFGAGAMVGGALAAARLSRAGRDGRIINSISEFNNRATDPSAKMKTHSFTSALFHGLDSGPTGQFNGANRSSVNNASRAAKAASASGSGSGNTYAGWNARVVGDSILSRYGNAPNGANNIKWGK